MSDTQIAGAPFTDLVTAGNFTEGMYAGFGEYDDRWSDRGDHIRGQKFVLLDARRAHGRMSNGFSMRNAVDRESRRLGCRLRIATAYELAYFASNGWNGTDSVMAMGSWYNLPMTGCHYAFIYGNGTVRGLDMIWAAVLPLRDMFVLCVAD
jgi:hypothetical protein